MRRGYGSAREGAIPGPAVDRVRCVDAHPQRLMLRESRPSLAWGVVVVVAGVMATTALVYPLGEVAPRVSLGVLYLLVVLCGDGLGMSVSARW